MPPDGLPQHVGEANDVGNGSSFHMQGFIRMFTKVITRAPCECGECRQQYRDDRALTVSCARYSRFVSIEQAKESMNEHMKMLRADQLFLRKALQLHGNTILSRWKERNRDRRADISQSSLPWVEVAKWAILRHSFGSVGFKDEAALRNTYLLPYLSLDNLKSDPLRLLCLLHC